MVGIPPTVYLQHNLDPISKKIDGYGGANVLMGIIASGGEPHIYITGNVQGNLKKEMYEALADKLREMAGNAGATTPSTPSLTLLQ
jgi:hypothetical protein